MTLTHDEFIRRFLLHVLPPGLHRIRHYGLFANAGRQDNLARVRELLISKAPEETIETVMSNTDSADDGDPDELIHAIYLCPACGSPMIIVDIIIASGQWPFAPPKLSGGHRCA